MMQDYFTTGQIAAMTQAAPRTVSKWIDEGELPGRRLPLSKDRRVDRADLYAFLKKHGYSTDLITMFDFGKAILFYGFRSVSDMRLFDELKLHYVTQFVNMSFDMAFILGRHKPNYLVINNLEYSDAPSIVKDVHKLDDSIMIEVIKSREEAKELVSRLTKGR